jgi:taurine transport system substrate-binding protein
MNNNTEEHTMDHQRRRVMKAALAATAAAGLPMIARAATTYKYGGSTWLGHYSAYIAIKTGIFSKLGLDIQWQSFGTSSERLGAVMAGQIDLAGTGIVAAMALMANGAKQFQVIATPNNYGKVEGLLVRSDVNSIADLKGKKIGVTFASSAHVLLLDLLKQAGMTVGSDVTIINMPAPNLPTAYQAKQVDAVAAWTPAFNRVRALPDTKVLADDTAFSLYKQYNVMPGPDVLLTTAKLGNENPDVVKKFLQGIFEANKMLSTAPDEATKVLVPLTQLSPAEQLETVKQVEWYTLEQQKSLLVSPGSFVTGMQKLADMLVDLKQIDKAPPVKDWVQGSYL